MSRKEDMISKRFIEETREEIYDIASNLVEDLVSEAIEALKSEIDEILRFIFHPNADLSMLDPVTKEQIGSIKDVFNLFKAKIKEEILSEIKKDLPKKITKVKLAKPGKLNKKKRKSRKNQKEENVK